MATTKSRPKASKASTLTPDELKNDPEFEEFLSLQRNVKKYVWSNDMDITGSSGGHQDDDDVVSGNDANESDSLPPDQEHQEEVKKFIQSEFTIKVRELPFKVKRGELKRWFAPLDVTRVKTPGRIRGIAYVSFKTKEQMIQALDKHKSIFKGKQVYISTLQKDGIVVLQSKKEAKPYHEIKESVADTGRLYVRNLSYTCTSQDLEDLFSPFGKLTEIYLPIDANSKKVKGFAFVTFVFPEHAIVAMDTLDKTKFQGRLLHILPGESKPEQYSHFNNLSSTFKQKKEQELREERNKSSTWNTLFLGANAAADVMSEKFNVKKSDLIADQNTSDSIAVRMALGETQIVNETKKFLIENGINLDAFTEEVIHEGVNPNELKIKKRSPTVILVKNLPVKTAQDEVEKLFAKYGIVSRVILPVHGVTAIVEMQEDQEAKKAFNSLINYKLNHVPIYLEWAPIDVFHDEKDKKRKRNPDDDGDAGTSTPAAAAADQIDGSKVRTDQSQSSLQKGIDSKGVKTDLGSQVPTTVQASGFEEGFRLFVKNISFNTTDEAFEQHFRSGEGSASLLSAKVSRRLGPSAQILSNGYGFVVYKSEKGAEKALKTLQNTLLDGHCLQLQRSRISMMPPPASSSPAFTASHHPSPGLDTAAAERSGRTSTVVPTGGEKMDLTGAGVTVSTQQSDQQYKGNTAAAAAPAKLLVKNVPFEASYKELAQVFSAFPGLKSLRLPKKMGATVIGSGPRRAAGGSGSHRGFAFIEYNSRTEAEKAMESLSASTHLYGRRLVLEWAKVGEEEAVAARDSLYDKSRVIGSDRGIGNSSTTAAAATKRFKKSELSSSLRSAAGTSKGGAQEEPLDFDPLA